MKPQPGASVPNSSDALTNPGGGSVQLSGWRLRLAWAGIAIVAVWGLVLNIVYIPVSLEAHHVAEPVFQALHVNARWRAGVPVVPQRGGVAEKAGMPEGRLVAVNGHPVAEDATIIDAARLAAGPIGEPVRLSVATAAGDTVTVSIVPTDALSPEFAAAGLSGPQMNTIRDGFLLLSDLVLLVVALVLLVRRGRSFVALVGAAAFIAAGMGTPFLDAALDVLNRSVDFGYGGVGFVLFLAFLVVFPDGRVRPRWAWWLPLAGVLQPVLTLSPDDPLDPGALVLFLLLALLVALPLLALWAQVIRYREYATADQRMQTRWAVLGAVVGTSMVIVGSIIQWGLPAAVGSGWYWWRDLVGGAVRSLYVLFPVGVLVSLLRYRLWDAEAAWSRSAMAAALTLALTAIVAGGTALTQAAFGASGPLALGLATATAAVLFVPLQRRLSDWADHRFLRDLTDLKEKLPDLVAHLRETESVEGIAEGVTDRVAPAVHAAHVALVVPVDSGWEPVGVEGVDATSTKEWTQTAELASPPTLKGTHRHPWRAVVWRQPEDRTYPVRVALRSERGGGELATEGWLLLGPRPDGSGYGPDDLEAVAEIAGPIGRALRVVRVREEREALLAAALAERDAALAATLADRDAQLVTRLTESLKHQLDHIHERMDSLRVDPNA